MADAIQSTTIRILDLFAHLLRDEEQQDAYEEVLAVVTTAMNQRPPDGQTATWTARMTPTGESTLSDAFPHLAALTDRVARLERKIDALLVARTEKDWYTTEEVALLVRRASWTVREWCRHRRVRARKDAHSDKWLVSREELHRLQTEGLLPVGV